MPRTVSNGIYTAAGAGATVLHTGAGRLFALLISHANAAVQTVTFYDNTAGSGTVLLKISLQPSADPAYIRFGPTAGRDEALSFSTGLTVNPANCDVLTWLAGY